MAALIEEKMKKAIAALEEDYKNIRAGRANPWILEKVKVEYYGTMSPINQVAGVSVPDARTIVIQPWDATILSEIEKAIQKSDIGINPNNDGKVIRLVFPPLSQERRKEIAKEIKKRAEEAKVTIRQVRRDAIENFKNQKKKGEMAEDAANRAEVDMQKLTDKHTKLIDEIADKKEREIMEV